MIVALCGFGLVCPHRRLIKRTSEYARTNLISSSSSVPAPFIVSRMRSAIVSSRWKAVLTSK